jgi:SpoVK/Ycf46/Vps4 family AAA+-type ATPase
MHGVPPPDVTRSNVGNGCAINLPYPSREATMTLDRAREIIAQQLTFGSGYNRNAVRLLLGEIQREHGLGAADKLIQEFDLEFRFGLRPGMDLTRVGR